MAVRGAHIPFVTHSARGANRQLVEPKLFRRNAPLLAALLALCASQGDAHSHGGRGVPEQGAQLPRIAGGRRYKFSRPRVVIPQAAPLCGAHTGQHTRTARPRTIRSLGPARQSRPTERSSPSHPESPRGAQCAFGDAAVGRPDDDLRRLRRPLRHRLPRRPVVVQPDHVSERAQPAPALAPCACLGLLGLPALLSPALRWSTTLFVTPPPSCLGGPTSALWTLRGGVRGGS